MIHAFAVDPGLVVAWVKTRQHRLARRSFGLGTPRALLELPKFRKWKLAVWKIADQYDLSVKERATIVELLEFLGELRCRRADTPNYEDVLSWLEKAEREHDRRRFGAILATENPRKHPGVLVDSLAELDDPRWTCTTGVLAARTPDAIAAALQPMLVNCRVVHVIDPYFGRYGFQIVLEEMMRVASQQGAVPEEVCVHCSTQDCLLANFERDVRQMAKGLPNTITVKFVRWKERVGGEKLHNRYVLTDLGGVSLGAGFEAGTKDQTDEVLLLPSDVYERRWKQYVENDGSFEKVDTPAPVRGTVRRGR